MLETRINRTKLSTKIKAVCVWYVVSKFNQSFTIINLLLVESLFIPLLNSATFKLGWVYLFVLMKNLPHLLIANDKQLILSSKCFLTLFDRMKSNKHTRHVGKLTIYLLNYIV